MPFVAFAGNRKHRLCHLFFTLAAMEDQDYFNTIGANAMAEFKDRGSRFLAYAYPVQSADEFKTIVQQLKKEHPKAVHHCFAYRIGLDGNNFRVSDDGEPSGTAGKPILGQIDSKGLTNTLVIVVRYFGGTLLGVPGLINAYRSASSMALQLTPMIQKPVTERWQLSFDYTRMNDVMRWLKAFNCNIIEQEMQLFCKLVADIPRNRVKEIKTIFDDIVGLEASRT